MGDLEWDPQKRETNLQKHALDFATLSDFFYDPYRLEEIDDRQDYGEQRIQAIGRSKGRVLFVVYTLRGGKRRIISGRKASDDERKKYETKKAAHDRGSH